jgi:hypothetical protein
MQVVEVVRDGGRAVLHLPLEARHVGLHDGVAPYGASDVSGHGGLVALVRVVIIWVFPGKSVGGL